MNNTHCQFCSYDLNDPENYCAKCEAGSVNGLASQLKVPEVQLVGKDECQLPSKLWKQPVQKMNSEWVKAKLNTPQVYRFKPGNREHQMRVWFFGSIIGLIGYQIGWIVLRVFVKAFQYPEWSTIAGGIFCSISFIFVYCIIWIKGIERNNKVILTSKNIVSHQFPFAAVTIPWKQVESIEEHNHFGLNETTDLKTRFLVIKSRGPAKIVLNQESYEDFAELESISRYMFGKSKKEIL